MGDAAKRRAAIRRGEPWPEDLHACPVCASRDTVVASAPPLALSHVETLMAACRPCGAVWEAYPPDWRHDAVEAQPCDNCAFRAGSPEIHDKAGWRFLLRKLRQGQEFKCHKGAPVLIDKDRGTVEFDADWVRRHGRTCAGFLRVMRQWPDWLENRYPGLAVRVNEKPTS